MALAVLLAPAAVRDLDALPDDRRQQVLAGLAGFARSPRWKAPRVKRLHGFQPPLYRLRSGDYRALFRVAGCEMHVYRVIDRKDLERALKALR